MKARFPSCLPRTILLLVNATFGKVSAMNGTTQLPSNTIAAFSLPSASPHQPTPSWAGVPATPLLIRPM